MKLTNTKIAELLALAFFALPSSAFAQGQQMKGGVLPPEMMICKDRIGGILFDLQALEKSSEIRCGNIPLIVDGIEKTCAGEMAPQGFRILCNFDYFNIMPQYEQYRLVHDEYAKSKGAQQ